MSAQFEGVPHHNDPLTKLWISSQGLGNDLLFQPLIGVGTLSDRFHQQSHPVTLNAARCFRIAKFWAVLAREHGNYNEDTFPVFLEEMELVFGINERNASFNPTLNHGFRSLNRPNELTPLSFHVEEQLWSRLHDFLLVEAIDDLNALTETSWKTALLDMFNAVTFILQRIELKKAKVVHHPDHGPLFAPHLKYYMYQGELHVAIQHSPAELALFCLDFTKEPGAVHCIGSPSVIFDVINVKPSDWYQAYGISPVPLRINRLLR